MSRSNPALVSLEAMEWPSNQCEFGESSFWIQKPFTEFNRTEIIQVSRQYDSNWADSVPALVLNLVSLISEKKKQEIRFHLLQIAANDFERRIHRLESIQTKIIPIDSFAPEPYKLLKTILVAVHCVEGGFNAGWFDANIHTSGDNEEEATSNLKSLILDVFDSLSNESSEKLGPEPTRQLAVLLEYIQKRP